MNDIDEVPMTMVDNNSFPGSNSPAIDRIYRALASVDRRRTLCTVREQAPILREDLPEKASERGSQTSGLLEMNSRHTALALHHRHIPSLEETRLITETSDGFVPTEHRLWDTGAFIDVIESEDPDMDAVLACLADPIRREIATVGERDAGTHARNELARVVAGRMPGGHTPENVEVKLHHHHLPDMDADGVIDYDIENRQVTYTGHPYVPRALELVGT